jgi:MFS family permease
MPLEVNMSALNPEAVNLVLARRQVLITVCLGAFMGTLDSGVVYTSLPRIAQSFHGTLAQVSWVMVAYLLVSTSLLLVCGRLGDLMAAGRLYLCGLLWFTGASALCGLSPSLSWLVASRALQGLGAAFLIALSPKLIVLVFEKKERGLPLGLLSASLAAGLCIGSPLGGVITTHLSWLYIFFLNIPLCGLTLMIGGRTLWRLPGGGAWNWKTLNLGGGFILAGTLAALFLIPIGIRDQDFNNLETYVVLGLGLGLIGLLFRLARLQAASFFPSELWRTRDFILGSLGVMLIAASFQGTFFLLPFFLEHIYHFTPYQSGWALMLLAVIGGIGAPVGGYLADRLGNLIILRLGAVLLLVGLGSLLLNGSEAPTLAMGVKLSLIGLGYGLFLPANLNEVLRGPQPPLIGLAAGSISLCKKIGALAGITLMVAVFAWVEQHHLVLHPGVYLKLDHFRLAFAAAALLGAVNLLVHLILRRPKA